MALTFHGESIIFLLMGLFFSAAALYARRSQQARQLHGLRTTATLIALTPTRRLFTPKVRFTTSDNREIIATTESAADAGQYEVGQKLEVVYDPTNPENVDIADRKPSGTSFMLLVGLLCLGVAALQILGYVSVFEEWQH